MAIEDHCTRECRAVEVDTSLTRQRVAVVLGHLGDTRGLQQSNTVDHGPEFDSQALDAWAFANGVRFAFIRACKPVDSAYSQSFNDKFPDECRSENGFVTMVQARRVIEHWRIEYND